MELRSKAGIEMRGLMESQQTVASKVEELSEVVDILSHGVMENLKEMYPKEMLTKEQGIRSAVESHIKSLVSDLVEMG